MFDILIINGTLVDGSGTKAVQSDVGIKGDRIVALGKIDSREAAKIIDATGCHITPGFIDCHSHSDMSIQADSRAESQIRQGVTTEIMGFCGISCAPCSDATREWIVRRLDGEKGSWSTFAEYLTELQECQPAVNLAGLVGHDALRCMAMPDSRAQTASQEQITVMQNLLTESLEQGGFGLSTGLEYFPGKAASLYELESLCSVVARFDAVHASHVRNRDTYALLAFAEVLEVARNTKSRVQISHINPKFGRAPHTIKHTLELIGWMREEGVVAGMDTLTTIWNHPYVISLLPMWAFDMPVEELLAILKDPARRAILRDNPTPLLQLPVRGHWDKIRLIGAKATKRHLGKTFAAIAEEYGCDGWDAVFALLAEEGLDMQWLLCASESFTEDDVLEVLQDPWCGVGSDAVATALDGPLKGFRAAPLTYEWVVAFLKDYVLTRNALSFEEGVRRISSLPAEQVKIKDRGLVVKNYFADLVIMKIDDLKVNGSLAIPTEYPTGIRTVIVNGKIALNDGVRESIHNGKVLRS